MKILHDSHKLLSKFRIFFVFGIAGRSQISDIGRENSLKGKNDPHNAEECVDHAANAGTSRTSIL